MRWQAVLVVALLGCYASHGSERPDAPILDTPSSDAPRLDVPRDTRGDASRDTPLSRTGCVRDADCDEGLCVLDVRVPPRDLIAVPLVCGAAGTSAPGTECEDNAECENGLCAFGGGCVEPCRDDRDCPSSDRCVDLTVITSLDTMQTARACARWVDAPSSTNVVENGDVTVSPFASNDLALGTAFAPRRLALLVADAQSDSRTIDRVTLDGTAISDLFGPSSNPAVAFFDLAPVLLPNAPVAPGVNLRGALRVSLTTDAEAVLHRVVLEHDGRGTTLDLNVYWVGITRTATRRAIVDRMLAGYGVLLESIGARLGRVRQRIAVGGTVDMNAVTMDEHAAAALFRYGAGAARPAVDVFLIGSGTTLLGLAGGVPGAQTMHGTQSSGVVLGLGDIESMLDAGLAERGFPAVVLAHEIGHFLGLFHTSETDGSSFEPLPDTDVCPFSRDANGDGFVDADECRDLDGENIMFWGVTFADSRFSPDQIDVIAGSPVMLP